MTLEDVANQLLLPILGDVDPAALKLSPEEEVVEAKLKKRMNRNAKCHIGLVPLLNSSLLLIVQPSLHSNFVSSSLALIFIML